MTSSTTRISSTTCFLPISSFSSSLKIRFLPHVSLSWHIPSPSAFLMSFYSCRRLLYGVYRTFLFPIFLVFQCYLVFVFHPVAVCSENIQQFCSVSVTTATRLATLKHFTHTSSNIYNLLYVLFWFSCNVETYCNLKVPRCLHLCCFVTCQLSLICQVVVIHLYEHLSWRHHAYNPPSSCWYLRGCQPLFIICYHIM